MAGPQLSPRFYYTFGPHEPAYTLASGESIELVCPDSDNELSDGRLLTAQEREKVTPPMLEANPMAGPIFVQGAEPGDHLAVTIEKITLDRRRGQTLIKPGHGLIGQELLEVNAADDPMPQRLLEWDIDVQRGTATLENGFGSRAVVLLLKPFVGCIGVCPAQGERVSAMFSGQHGGNMDLPLTAQGTTIYLPVHEPGGLLMLGDLHAAQGHGEIVGGAIETSGRVTLKVSLVKGKPIEAPRFEDARVIAAAGCDNDLRTAIRRAYAHLLTMVVERSGLNRWDAYMLISQCGSLVVGGLLEGPFTVAACLSRDLLDG